MEADVWPPVFSSTQQRRQLERSRTETSSVPEIRDHALRHHRAIRSAIASGDRRAARAAMDEHMQQTLDDLESFVAGATPTRQADESNRAAG
ncbi:FCD domain-containing protein [Saccharopolyspora mangrovi]|uniref:FCD domain-containing protein n=1 Tax=Saccharopolyspora mangrovi TaxID=3082379 RepID=A0ABU6AKG0_9PSEU|nr:FCD domain-containing protein [Saccharopolyspora sp. S2-29]MEB3371790.1 FCD domain-containing protein [Saccharopolyspora sp. S2-29]